MDNVYQPTNLGEFEPEDNFLYKAYRKWLEDVKKKHPEWFD